MVKHIIIWNFKEEYTPDQKSEFAAKIKAELEALIDKIDGLLEIKVYTVPIGGSNGDLMLDSTMRDEAALKFYQEHPDHMAAASFVRSVVSERKCFDYVI
jgi:hypothetical protein